MKTILLLEDDKNLNTMIAGRDFEDILDAVERFFYFESRKKEENGV